MVARKIDYSESLSLRVDRADFGLVTEVDDQSEALESHVLKKTTIPRLE